MSLKLKAIGAAILLFGVIFTIVQFFAPDKFLSKVFKKSGTLRVDSAPPTNVFIDSNLVGKTPLQITLQNGIYTIKLVPESSDKEVITFSSKIRIFHNVTTYINRELKQNELTSAGEILTLEKSNGVRGQILVSSEPQGMFVSLDGEDRGIAPLFMDNVNPGEHELGIRGEGFVPRTMKINVVAGYKLLADFKLAVDEEYQVKKEKEQQQKKQAKEREKANRLTIKETPTGWLRVRSEPSLGASESARVNTGETFLFFSTEGRWYEVEYEPEKRGWVYGDYVSIVEEQGQEESEKAL